MNIEEAREWLTGNRSMTNIVPQDPHETWVLRIEQSDAAKMEQAYWLLKAYKENLVPCSPAAGGKT